MYLLSTALSSLTDERRGKMLVRMVERLVPTLQEIKKRFRWLSLQPTPFRALLQKEHSHIFVELDPAIMFQTWVEAPGDALVPLKEVLGEEPSPEEPGDEEPEELGDQEVDSL